MSWFARKPSRDPARIRETLQQLCHELAESLGEDLESIVLYGSFARSGELETEHDSVNLMLVVRTATCHTLDKMTAALARAEQAIPLATMTLTREELHSSCDVFPIKFHDMQLHHRVLSGDNVLSDLHISDEHLRLRCEQQLKNLMLRLRALYLHGGQRDRQLLDALLEANRNFLQDIHACLVVKTGMAPEDATDLPAAFGAEFGLDTKVVHDVLAIGRAADGPGGQELKATFDRFMRLVHDSARAVDQMEVQS